MNQPISSEDAVVERALKDGALYKQLLDQIDTGIYIVDRERRIRYWNTGAERITGYLSHEVAGQFCHGDLLVHCDDAGSVLCGTRCPLQSVMRDGRPRECPVFLRHKQGHRIPVHVRSTPICDGAGSIIGALETFEEACTPARRVIAQLRDFGCLDELTGAACRRYGELRFRHALDGLNEFGIPFEWLRVGLDGADQLEQRYGHGMIDAALKTIARTAEGILGGMDLVIRWSQTEFRIGVHYSSRWDLGELAEKLVALVRASVLEWWGDRLRLTVSVAGTTAEHGDTLDSLEARLAEVFDGCRAGGGDRAAIAQPLGEGRDSCLP